MLTEDLLGLAIPVTYLFMLVAESLWPARRFPDTRGWHWIGIIAVIMLMSISVVCPLLIPVDWIAKHSLFQLSRWPEVPAILLGFLCTSFVNFVWHRNEHRVNFLFHFFHQLHHSPVRVDISGSAFTTPQEVVIMNVINIFVNVFVLGLSPLAIATVGFIAAFYAMFQHWNIRTPIWLGYVIQRPESHCIHHQYDVHGYNYSDFPPWDMLFGSFKNPGDFSGRAGFDIEAGQRYAAMLAGINVNHNATGLHP